MEGTHENVSLQAKLKESLKPYPRLYHALFSKQAPGGVCQDISVYKLLQVILLFYNYKL